MNGRFDQPIRFGGNAPAAPQAQGMGGGDPWGWLRQMQQGGAPGGGGAGGFGNLFRRGQMQPEEGQQQVQGWQQRPMSLFGNRRF